MPATSGLAALVPPMIVQPPAFALYDATPVFGSPTAETSDVMRYWHAVLLCQLGFAMLWLHALPPLDHARSVQPRVLLAGESDVPPTPIVYAEVDG